MSVQFFVNQYFGNPLKKFIAGIFVVSFVLSATSNANANSKYAAIVIDANTGKVLHASNADARRYPASLTKMMTLYVLFDYLKKGRLTKSTKFYVTPYASGQPPSKLGLRAGTYIRVGEAIGALVTKSANDVATTVAENIAGSETKFARMMTRKAKALGMRSTVFKNASGLPNRYQTTTARDMVILSMRIMNDFPAYSKAFKTKYYKYGRRSYRNHNRLLFSYRGTEGIKTGYTRDSGFNLTSSVKRGRKHLIAVVMGGKTAGRRNRAMTNILNKSFPKATAPWKKASLAERMARIDPRLSRKPLIRYAEEKSKPANNQKRWTKNSAKKYASRPTDSMRSYSLGEYVGRSSRDGYDIQIGAFEDRNIAVGKLTNTKHGAGNILEGHEPYIVQYRKNGINYHRARFAGFSSRTTALSACGHLKKKLKTDCIVMLP